jgi:hypothetical protein
MASDSEWLEVSGQCSVDALLSSTRGFHDSVAMEGRWVGAEFINRRGELELHGYGQLCLLITSQFEDVGSVELKFNGVSSFHYDYDQDLEPSILLNSIGVRARLGAWEIVAERLEYRLNAKIA